MEKENEMTKNIPIKDFEFVCPLCGGKLKFDIHDRKQHCRDCKRIWSFEIDNEGKRLIVHRWLKIEGVNKEEFEEFISSTLNK